MNKFLSAIVFATLCLLAAPGIRAQALSAETIDRVVAVVEEDVILQSELDRSVNSIMAQYTGRTAELPPRDVLERQVLERIIMIRLQLQRADGTGIRVSDTELDQAVQRLAEQNKVSMDQLRASLERDGFSWEEFRKTMREELVVQRMRQRFVQSRVVVTDTEVEILLASDSLKRGEVRLSHILIAVPDGASPEEIQTAREKAESVRKEIDGGLQFDAAAIRYSGGQQALEGGDLGWRRYDEVPSVFTDLIVGLQVGDVTQPLRGPSGFHILKLVDKREETKEIVNEYHARHIMFRTSELVSSDEALAAARNVRKQIVAGGDFAKLARDLSEDKTTANLGGDMDWFAIGVFGTRVEQVVSSLKDGELSEPFQTESGWHVLERLGSRVADRTEETQREQAREIIRNRKAEEEYDAFIRQLRAESYTENRLTGKETVTGEPPKPGDEAAAKEEEEKDKAERRGVDAEARNPSPDQPERPR